jgi:hypothetical protein
MDQLSLIYEQNLIYEWLDFSGHLSYWSTSNLYPNNINLDNGSEGSQAVYSSALNCICIRQF